MITPLNTQISSLFLRLARNASTFSYIFYKEPRNSNIWSRGAVKELYKSFLLAED